MNLYESQWVFITRYTQFTERSNEFTNGNMIMEDDSETIEMTIDRAKEVVNGQIVNMIGLNNDLQKVFRELTKALNAIEGYEDYFKADLTNIETMLGEG
jgi:hypothetical protein